MLREPHWVVERADRQDRYDRLPHSQVLMSAMIEDLLARVTIVVSHKHASRFEEFPVHQQRSLNDVWRSRRNAFLCFLKDKHKGGWFNISVISLSDHG